MNKKRGSGILVVILSTVVFSIYASSTFAEEEHTRIAQVSYERIIRQHYEKDLDKIEDIYQEILRLSNK